MPKRDNAPPENRLNNASMLPACWSKNDASAAGSTPGTGINVPARKTINAPTRNMIRFFSSPSLAPDLAVSAGFVLGPFATILSLKPVFSYRPQRGLLRHLVVIPVYYSMLPPAASIAARAPLVTARPLVLTAFEISPDLMTFTFNTFAGTRWAFFNTFISIMSSLGISSS